MPSPTLAILSSLLLVLVAPPPTLASPTSLHLVPRGELSPIATPISLEHGALTTQGRRKDKLRIHAEKTNKRPSDSSSAFSTPSTKDGRLTVPSSVRHKSIWSILVAAAAMEEEQVAEDELEEEEVEDEFEEEGDGGDMLSLEERSRQKRAISEKQGRSRGARGG